jgi:hypothetical protein
VDADIDPLNCHSHQMHHGAYNSFTFMSWIAWNSQADSGEYSCHMDNSFAVAGPLLDSLHLPECEGAEFELESDIQAVMKRCKEDEQDNRLATNRNIFLALSSINFPLIAPEKNTTIPPLQSTFHFFTS